VSELFEGIEGKNKGDKMKSNMRCPVCHCRRKSGHERRCGTEKANHKDCVVYKKMDNEEKKAFSTKIKTEMAEHIQKELDSCKKKEVVEDATPITGVEVLEASDREVTAQNIMDVAKTDVVIGEAKKIVDSEAIKV